MKLGIQEVFGKMIGEIDDCLKKVSDDSVQKALSHIKAADRVFLAGTGRSSLGIRGFAIRLVHLGIHTYMVGETTTPPIRPKDCLIVGSGSGRTPGLLAVAQKAHSVGAHVVLFTIDRDSPIAQCADTIVVIPAPSPKAQISATEHTSVQPMGSLFEQCLFLALDALVMVLMRESNTTSAEMFARHANLE